MVKKEEAGEAFEPHFINNAHHLDIIVLIGSELLYPAYTDIKKII